VGLNSDSSVRKLKEPTRPIQTEADRARIVGALRAVDLVVLFDDLTPLTLIEAISPDVLVKGADYSEEQVVRGDLVKARAVASRCFRRWRGVPRPRSLSECGREHDGYAGTSASPGTGDCRKPKKQNFAPSPVHGCCDKRSEASCWAWQG
jgi:glycerol-3-phosphate cytidylyltransferase-like family protein